MTNIELVPFADRLRDAHPLWSGYSRQEQRVEAARALSGRYGGAIPPLYMLDRLAKMVSKPWAPHPVNPETPHLLERFHRATRMLNAELGELLNVHFTQAAHFRTGRRRFNLTPERRQALLNAATTQRNAIDALIKEIDRS